jgi:hypothetical protein
MKITKKKKKEIIDFVEMYECKASGKSMLNGGYATADDVEIFEMNGTYIVFAEITLGDYFDTDHPCKEVYDNCKYYLDKEDFHLLTDKELQSRGFDGREERDTME